MGIKENRMAQRRDTSLQNNELNLTASLWLDCAECRQVKVKVSELNGSESFNRFLVHLSRVISRQLS